MSGSNREQGRGRRAVVIFCRVAVYGTALLLLLVALSKAWAPMIHLKGLARLLGHFPPLWVTYPLVAGEILLAGWLASGLKPRLAIGFAALAFMGFSIVHLVLLKGSNPGSCGCLGGFWLSALGRPPRPWVEPFLAIGPAFFLANAFFLHAEETVPQVLARPRGWIWALTFAIVAGALVTARGRLAGFPEDGRYIFRAEASSVEAAPCVFDEGKRRDHEAS